MKNVPFYLICLIFGIANFWIKPTFGYSLFEVMIAVVISVPISNWIQNKKRI